VGPEGGFQPDEISAATLRCRLGDTILRVETAAIAAVSVMLTGG
jgi:16S rRNA U1498 N3-methylase RsmE